MINGRNLPKGKYGFHAIPNKTEWILKALKYLIYLGAQVVSVMSWHQEGRLILPL
ncbi:MAG: hypothetical protein ACK4S0_09750 [Sediminibacterium sp.]